MDSSRRDPRNLNPENAIHDHQTGLSGHFRCQLTAFLDSSDRRDALYSAEERNMSSKRPNLSRNTPAVEEDRDSEVHARPPFQRVLVRRLDRRTLVRPQGPDSGINAIFGRIPADDDDDEEVIALLEELS